MANIKSQIKRVKTNEKRRQRNQHIRSAVRTEIRKLRALIAEGNKEAAAEQLKVTSRALDKAVTKGVLHRNNAANKKSRLAQAVNKIEA
ncbi:30S ribosomal protein S20 [Corynebacterium choanae]|uniref:Small ribosomal subunit protein bS20 n=1 Tax=Corynebacterium choanae TaxID=1862358 RepID=A0A3G6J7K7_9CORY|nr:30S ribosomal protein S20 [Corynebacterium choanae]AZA14101.1 30S ribosomal protein S20 [Corynebacterium choanae]